MIHRIGTGILSSRPGILDGENLVLLVLVHGLRQRVTRDREVRNEEEIAVDDRGAVGALKKSRNCLIKGPNLLLMLSCN